MLRKMVAPSSRLELWQRAYETRLNYIKLGDLFDHGLYNRLPKLPKAVPRLIFKLATLFSTEDPSLSKITIDWMDPFTGETHHLLRRWTMFSRANLVSQMLTLHKEDFEKAMDGTLSRRKYGADSKVPSKYYVGLVISKYNWLSNSKQYYGTYFGCGLCSELEKNVSEFRDLVLLKLKNCQAFQCCGAMADEPCLDECRGICVCKSCSIIEICYQPHLSTLLLSSFAGLTLW